ncbi:MAG: DUF4126 domain-containing protein [Gammaproteobacteria bacterium]|nr:DUF4126 domain-containing protein [Gammaproteobacteria bacterium]
METTAAIALAAGSAWASGLNLYAVLFMLGLLGTTGHMTLPPDLEVLMNPMVMAAAGFMYCVEFFADKTPGVDSAWDAAHTFIRIPAGAVLAAAAMGEMDPALQIAAFIIGGGLAAGSHATKTGARLLVNTSPEPVTNWTASVVEDVAVFAGIWTALNYPVLFLALLVVVVALMAWVLPKLWRVLRGLFRTLRQRFRSEPQPGGPPANPVLESRPPV